VNEESLAQWGTVAPKTNKPKAAKSLQFAQLNVTELSVQYN